MDQTIFNFIQDRYAELESIDIDRQDDLNVLAEIIGADLKSKDRSRITVICTHNSRRSQLAEFLLRIMAHHFNIEGIQTYSGGTEATAFNHRMVKALKEYGFSFTKSDDLENPRYQYQSEYSDFDQVMFSKVYNDAYNPSEEFIALMVCDHADQNCPIVSGASHRISLPYLDPKASDDTPDEKYAYAEKVKEIGREMLYLCERVLMN